MKGGRKEGKRKGGGGKLFPLVAALVRTVGLSVFFMPWLLVPTGRFASLCCFMLCPGRHPPRVMRLLV